jgi:hypothetical protein
MNNQTEPRPLAVIAYEIKSDWRKPYFGAIPYLDGMRQLHSIDDRYGFDNGKTLVVYFLANAQTWRGDVAKRVKAELKALIK